MAQAASLAALVSGLASFTLVASGLAAAHRTSATAVLLSRHPIREDPAWRSYVLDQGPGVVYPQHVYVEGAGSQVRNPDGLMQPGGGATTITSRARGDVQLILDLGINAGGYVEVGITANSGTTVRLGYSEARRFLTPDGDTGVPANSVGVPFVTDPSLGQDDDPGGRYDDFTGTGQLRSVGIRGAQRWISLELEGPGSVSVDYVRVREEHLHPAVTDYAGHFLSSDTLLNRIWYAGVYTFALDAFKDLRAGHNGGNVVVTDGAKRDRLVWLGDLVVENLLGGYALPQASRIIRDSIQLFSCQQHTNGELPSSSQIAGVCPPTPPAPSSGGGDTLPEYTAWWVIALHDYDVLSGDDRFARAMLPVARRAMAYFLANLDSRGLYSTPPDSINWHPFDVASGEDTHTNSVIYRGLLDLADLERRLGSRLAATTLEQRAEALRAAVVAALWDPTVGAFLLSGSDPQRNHTQDAQVEAVLDGVVTGSRAASALRFIDRHLETRYGVRNGESDDDPYMSNYISPYISSTELLARLARHDTAGALSLLRREWGRMVEVDPNSTLWEKMSFSGDAASYQPNQTGTGIYPTNAPGAPGGTSLAHGWAGGAVPALSGYVLGIRALAPGYGRWIVEPQVGDLRFAQGQAPTPHDVIVSRWQRADSDHDGDTDSFVLTVSGPRGTRGTVAIPLLGQPRVIARDGRIVKPASVGGGYARFYNVTGTHTWAWAGAAGSHPAYPHRSARRPSLTG